MIYVVHALIYKKLVERYVVYSRFSKRFVVAMFTIY